MGEGRDWPMLVVLCVAALLSGVLEVVFVPLYIGSVIFPLVIACAVAGNVLMPRVGRGLVSSAVGSAAPFVAWLVPVLGLALVSRPEGDVVIAGGNAEQWVYYGVLLGGCVAGFTAIVTAGTRR